MNIRIGLVDDHQLFLHALALMLDTLTGFEVVLHATNGIDLQQKMAALSPTPQIILLDVNMPQMDGVATATWLHQHHADIRIVALSMNNTEDPVIRMLQAGCCGYIAKDAHPSRLKQVLMQVHQQGFAPVESGCVHPGRIFNKLCSRRLKVTGKEQQFLELACSERTYKQIASDMHISERTADGYREILFRKFGVQSRVGMCLEALRTGMVDMPSAPLGSVPQ